MIGLGIWIGTLVTLLIAPHATDGKNVRKATNACGCYCGLVVAQLRDLPPAESGETRRVSHLWGDAVTVCFTQPRADATARMDVIREGAVFARDRRELADTQRWRR